MNSSNFVRLTTSMKYVSLYWNLGFVEIHHDIFEKKYGNYTIALDSEKQTVDFHNGISVVNGVFKLDTYKSFVVLELVNRLLELNYSPLSIIIDMDNAYDVLVSNLYFRCYEWDNLFMPIKISKSNKFYSVCYESRLVSGCIETNYIVDFDGKRYNDGLLVNKNENIILKNKKGIESVEFKIDGTKLLQYIGKGKSVVKIPYGITDLSSGVFWDNQEIEEVIIPDTVKNLGGDTFYKCSNLRKIVIPSSVEFMGDNPFAGCPKLVIENKSPNFIYENDTLFNKNKTVLIHHNIESKNKVYEIPNSVIVVGKHSFYMSELEKVIIPENVYRLANNPFSDSDKLKLECYSKNYIVKDGVIYKRDMTTIIGTLKSVNTERLVLENVEKIDRNSFYNCKGIKTLVLPSTLKEIGYNPFVGCSNIEFENHSSNFVVENGILYNKDKSVLICYPNKIAKGKVDVIESVTRLERGAFSGCQDLTEINLHNVSIVGKSCFTNCVGLKEVYLSDLVSYIGIWCFAHCSNLRKVECSKDCIIDDMALLNTTANLVRRTERENYLIESDNKFTLESMLNNYENKIDSILIDPPYNSHIDYIGYKDGDYDNGYFNFMNERIKLSYKLLSDKGFLVINIDEGEVENLTNLCEIVFGKELVTVHRWKKKHPYFDKNRVILNPNKVQTDFEYIIICRKSNNCLFNKISQPYIKKDKLYERLDEVPETFDCFGTTSSAKDEINEIFGSRDYFSTPKPVKLMKELIRATTTKDSLVMDYFAGSGTVGQAVHELNLEDNGSRKFILVCNSESNICRNVTKKRLDKFNIKYSFLK